jgi:ATP-binding cassette, subfamily B, bacterial
MWVVVYTVLSVLGTIVWTMQPAVIGQLLNSIQNANGVTSANMQYVVLLVFALLGVECFSWVFHGPSRIIEQENAFRAMQIYRRHLMHGVLALPVSWHGEHDTGQTLDKIDKACDGLLSFGKNSFQVVQFLTRMVVTSLVLGYYSPLIAVCTVVLILVSFYVTYQFDIRIIVFIREIQKKEHRLVAKITDSLTNIFTVKILHIEQPLLEGVMEASRASHSLYSGYIRIQEWKWFVGAAIFSVISLVPLFVYIWITTSTGSHFEVGTFTALYLYSSNLIYVFYAFNGNFEELLRWRARIQSVEDIEEAIALNEKHPRHRLSAWKTLHVLNVDFAYDEGSQHLQDVSMSIRAGERIALIGTSGSGKTTFLKVLHGMYSSASGQYCTDGHTYHDTNFANIDIESTLVPQEPEVFSSTIRENMTLAMDFTDEEIAHAMQLARFADVVPTLPNGLDSVVNEKGVNLSGGQKQRLALARALLFSGGKKVLLLDESTSSVDPENESLIYSGIFAEWSGCTIIASIHKLNLLKHFDRIIIFERGKIVDDGTFNDLLKRNAPFRIQWAEYVKSHQGE